MADLVLQTIDNERSNVAGMPEQPSFIALMSELAINGVRTNFDTVTICYSACAPGIGICSKLIDEPWKPLKRGRSLATEFARSKDEYILMAVRHVMGHVWMEAQSRTFLDNLEWFQEIYASAKEVPAGAHPKPSVYGHNNLYDFMAESYVAWRLGLVDDLPPGVSDLLDAIQRSARPIIHMQMAHPNERVPTLVLVDDFRDSAGGKAMYIRNGLAQHCDPSREI